MIKSGGRSALAGVDFAAGNFPSREAGWREASSISGLRKPWRSQMPSTCPKSICVSPFQGICANLSTVAINSDGSDDISPRRQLRWADLHSRILGLLATEDALSVFVATINESAAAAFGFRLDVVMLRCKVNLRSTPRAIGQLVRST